MSGRTLRHGSAETSPSDMPAEIAHADHRESLREIMHRVTLQARDEISEAVAREFKKPADAE